MEDGKEKVEEKVEDKVDQQLQKLRRAMQAQSIIPDVLDSYPDEFCEVKYPEQIVVDCGNVLKPKQVKDKPTVKWNFEHGVYYTLAMIDPDAPSREDPKFREWHHWLVGNIQENFVHTGYTLSDYIGAGPPKGTGLHRYIFLVFKQAKRINFTEDTLSNKSSKNRGNFSIKGFAEKYKLGHPHAGNFFYAEYDDYVPTLYKQINCC